MFHSESFDDDDDDKHKLPPKQSAKSRDSINKYKPWLHSTGPKTQVGKSRSAQNGRMRQTGRLSRRQIDALLREAKIKLEDAVALLKTLDSDDAELEDDGPHDGDSLPEVSQITETDDTASRVSKQHSLNGSRMTVGARSPSSTAQETADLLILGWAIYALFLIIFFSVIFERTF